MSIRPVVGALGGGLLGMSTLFLSTAPAAHATPRANSPQLEAAPAQATDTAAAVAADGPLSGQPRIVAHRGASGYAPENTLAAVDKANELGIDWVENDVQRTKDGELIVMHDATLDRTTDAEEVYPERSPWKVGDFTADEIAKLDAGSSFSEEFAGEKVPTLTQYLERVSENDQRLLLELKDPARYPGIEADTLNQLREAGWLDRQHVKSKLVVQSFDANAVKAVHGLKPSVQTGFLGQPKTDELKTYARFVDQINPKSSAVSKQYVRDIKKLRGPHGDRLQVHTWTVDDAATARKVNKAGVDGIISNKPDVVRDALSG